jgi:hypothetical protein
MTTLSDRQSAADVPTTSKIRNGGIDLCVSSREHEALFVDKTLSRKAERPEYLSHRKNSDWMKYRISL